MGCIRFAGRSGVRFLIQPFSFFYLARKVRWDIMEETAGKRDTMRESKNYYKDILLSDSRQKNPHSYDVRNEDECVILQLHFHSDVFMDLLGDSLRDNQLYFLLDLTLGQKNFIQDRCSEQLYCSIRYVYEETKNKKANYQKLIDLYFARLWRDC